MELLQAAFCNRTGEIPARVVIFSPQKDDPAKRRIRQHAKVGDGIRNNIQGTYLSRTDSDPQRFRHLQ